MVLNLNRLARTGSLFFLLLVFGHGVYFVRDGWLLQRVGLGHLLLFFGILIDCRGLCRVVARISLFQAVADVDSSALATLGDSHGAGPPE